MPITFGASARRLLNSGGGGSRTLDTLDDPNETYTDSYPGSSKAPFLDLKESTYINQAIDDINEVLGLLIPAEPPLFPANNNLSFSTQNDFSLCGNTDTFYNGNTLTVGNSYSTVFSNSITSNQDIHGSGPGDQGVFKLSHNGVIRVSSSFNAYTNPNDVTVSSTDGKFSFVIYDNLEYPDQDQPFWQTFSVKEAKFELDQGANKLFLEHETDASTQRSAEPTIIYDHLMPLTPIVEIKNVSNETNDDFCGGIPHLTHNSTVDIEFSGSDTTGVMYRNSNFCQIAGNNVDSETLTYKTLNGGNSPDFNSDLGDITRTTGIGDNPGVVEPSVRLWTRNQSTDYFRGSNGDPIILSIGDRANKYKDYFIPEKIPVYIIQNGSRSDLTTASSSYIYRDGAAWPASGIQVGDALNLVSLPKNVDLSEPGYEDYAVPVAGRLIHSKVSYANHFLAGPNYTGKSSEQYFIASYKVQSKTNVNMSYVGQISDLNILFYNHVGGQQHILASSPFNPNPLIPEPYGSFVVTPYDQNGNRLDEVLTEFPKSSNNINKVYQFSFGNYSSIDSTGFFSGEQTIAFIFKLTQGHYIDKLAFHVFG